MKFRWIKLMAACVFALAAAPMLSADAALKPEVRAQVGECAQNPQKLKQTIAATGYVMLSVREETAQRRSLLARLSKRQP